MPLPPQPDAAPSICVTHVGAAVEGEGFASWTLPYLGAASSDLDLDDLDDLSDELKAPKKYKTTTVIIVKSTPMAIVIFIFEGKGLDIAK